MKNGERTKRMHSTRGEDLKVQNEARSKLKPGQRS